MREFNHVWRYWRVVVRHTVDAFTPERRHACTPAVIVLPLGANAGATRFVALVYTGALCPSLANNTLPLLPTPGALVRSPPSERPSLLITRHGMPTSCFHA